VTGTTPFTYQKTAASRLEENAKENRERETKKLLETKNCPPHHAAIDNPHRGCSD
jgi:hypothetical protein